MWQGFIGTRGGTQNPVTRQQVMDFARTQIDSKFQKCFYPIKNQALNPPPAVYYSLRQYPNIGKHILSVQASQPQWKTLHYAGPNFNKFNRPLAMRGTKPCPAGQSRDEYPLPAHWKAGGSAKVQCVPVSEQDAQRNLMSKFYREEGLKQGDAFRVEVTP